MAQFKFEAWDLSNAVEKDEMAKPEEGLRYLKITNAECGQDKIYTIWFMDLTSEIEFRCKYWLNKTNVADDGTILSVVPDIRNQNALIGLGKALAGGPIGVPPAKSIIGGVIIGEVTYNKKGYPSVYHFEAAPKGLVTDLTDLRDENGEPAQYYTEEE